MNRLPLKQFSIKIIKKGFAQAEISMEIMRAIDKYINL